jgi:putative transposase
MQGCDYTEPGWYMVSICTQDAKHLFGDIQNDKMVLNEIGISMLHWWLKIGLVFKQTTLDAFVIMPNHLHGIITISPVGADPCVRPVVSNGCPVVSDSRPEISNDHPDRYVCPDLIAENLLEIHPHRNEILRTLESFRQSERGGCGRGESGRGGHMGPPLRGPSLFEAMQWFKSMTTNEYIRGVKSRGWPRFDKHVWQRGYYESVIRSDRSLDAARDYIFQNPQNWERDEYQKYTRLHLQ